MLILIQLPLITEVMAALTSSIIENLRGMSMQQLINGHSYRYICSWVTTLWITEQSRWWGHGRDGVVIWFFYNYLCIQCLSPLKLCVRMLLNTALCDKVFQWLATGRWFSPVSSNNKTDLDDITEILLKVALNTITLTPSNDDDICAY